LRRRRKAKSEHRNTDDMPLRHERASNDLCAVPFHTGIRQRKRLANFKQGVANMKFIKTSSAWLLMTLILC
jgi:hypothetical protein